MENEKIDRIEKAGSDFMEAIKDLRPFMAVAIAARDFMHDPENWESYRDLLTSNSAAIPPEFMKLGETVEAAFGEPSGDADDEDEPPAARNELRSAAEATARRLPGRGAFGKESIADALGPNRPGRQTGFRKGKVMSSIGIISTGDPDKDREKIARAERFNENINNGVCPNGCGELEFPSSPFEGECPVCHFHLGTNVPYGRRVDDDGAIN